MKQQIQIKIAEPCQENWNSMLPTEQGRFCMNCQKQVVDFSTMTDKEILEHISAASKSICGRAGNDQLNRLLVAPPEPRKLWWRYWMGLAASFVLLTSRSDGQAKVAKDSIVATPPLPNQREVLIMGKMRAEPEAERPAAGFVILGIIKDADNTPVPYATVIIKDSKRGVQSNEKGFFRLELKDANEAVLQISSIGFETQEMKVKRAAPSQNLANISVVLRPMVMGLLGEVVVVKKKKRSWLNYFKKDTVAICESPLLKQTISIYPNPVVKGTEIKMKINNLPEGKYRLSFIDLMGNEVAEKEISITAKNAAAALACDQRFATGMYVVNLTGHGKTISSKCIVQ